MMTNFLSKWRKRDNRGDHDHGRSTALAQRERHGNDWGLGGFRQEMAQTFDRIWRDLDRGDPWSALSHLPESFGAPGDWPAIDMAEDDNAVTLRVDVPGMDASDIDVEVSGNVLTLRGQRTDEWSHDRKGVYHRERRSGSFVRTVPLPEYVEADRIEARYDRGTLTLTAPKAPGKGPRRVPVKA